MWQPERALQKVVEEGRTRIWLAEFIGQTPQSINSYLSGRRIPTKPIVKLFAQALNTTETYLTGEDIKASQKEVQVSNSA